MQNLDFALLNFIHDNLACKFLDVTMPIVSLFGNKGLFWIAIALVLVCIKKTRKVGVSMAVAIALGFLIGNLTIKPLVGRIRPYDINTSVTLLVAKLKDASFPSGHTLICFECAAVLFRYYKKAGIAALAFACLMAFSRLYLYVHFPTDVLGGAILGIAVGNVAVVVTNLVYRKIQNKN